PFLLRFMADPPCDDAHRNCAMPSLALIGLGHRRDLPGIELVDVVDQIVAERIERLLDDVLLEQPIVVRLIGLPDAFAPPLESHVSASVGQQRGPCVLQCHFVREASVLVDPVSCLKTPLPTEFPPPRSRSRPMRWPRRATDLLACWLS